MNSEWTLGKLSDIADIIMGQSPSGEMCSNEKIGLPLLNGPTEFGSHHPTPVQFTTDPRKIAQENDILFCVRGSTTGRMNWADQQYAIGRGIAAIRHKNSSQYRHFVKGVLKFKLPTLLASATGSTFPNVSKDQLSNVEFIIPPLDEQKAIAHILGTLDDKIELNQQMNHTLEAIARALFQSWFINFDPVRAKMDGRQPAGMDAETAALFPDEFEDSALGKIPKGWEVSSLGKLFPKDNNCVITGPFGSNLHAHDYRSEGVPLILVKHINNGRIQEEGLPLVGKHKLPDLNRYRLEIGDIIFSRVGAVGRTAYIYPRYAGCLISGQTLRVRVSQTKILNSRYLAQIYLEPSFIKMVEGHALGTTRLSLNTKLLQSFQFIVPPIAVQNKFVQLINSFDLQIQANLSETKLLIHIRDPLLPKLLSGQVQALNKSFEKIIENKR